MNGILALFDSFYFNKTRHSISKEMEGVRKKLGPSSCLFRSRYTLVSLHHYPFFLSSFSNIKCVFQQWSCIHCVVLPFEAPSKLSPNILIRISCVYQYKASLLIYEWVNCMCVEYREILYM